MSKVSKFILDALGEGVSRRSVRLTVRLTNDEYAKLLMLVDVMKTNKTALGEKILGHALDEAFATYLDTLDEIATNEAIADFDRMIDGFVLSDQSPYPDASFVEVAA